MAERTILGILIFLSIHQTLDAALDVLASSPQRALVAKDTDIICFFSVDKQPLDTNFLAILWHFQGNVILRYDNKGCSSQDPRMTLDVESLKNGNASLHISNVTISDGGIYKCSIIYSPESKEKEISFEVLAKPVLSILNMKLRRNTENTLTCRATGFFPPDIGITWYRNGEVLGNQFMGIPQMYKDATYYMDSTVTITPTTDDQNQTFSCRVQHDSLQGPLQRDYHPDFEEMETSSHTVIVVCILVLITIFAVGIGFFLWRQKYRKKDEETFTLMDIEGPTKLIAGEEASIFCKATKFPENTNVTWLEKRRGQVYEIPESHGGDKEEEERLMDTQYGVISCREGPNYTSSLKFRPSMANHKDVTFICRYSHGKEKKEKTFHCRAIYAKPQLLQPISQRLFVSEELKYLVTLEKFYPKNIKIRWTHGVGDPQEILPSTETFTDISDGTYNVCSEVRIPEELLKDPEFRVRVSWEHESLDTLGYKDLSIRDPEYPWNPVVEEIQTPKIFPDIPVTLQCHISEYFPNAITVTWLRKSENQEICEETDNMVSNTVTPRREADNTYRCTARLTISPKLSVHQGAEYICRVDHPSLEKPIEKKTGKLIVMAKPQMEEPIEITMGDSSRVLFTLNLQKFYPENIEIEWTCEHKDNKFNMTWNNNSKKYDDLTNGVTSVSSIPMYMFDDLQTKVSVTWKHKSMDEPETRTLTMRDLPWCPQVGDIIIPNLEEDKEACLTCDISGYFPDHLKVIWFKKEPGTDSPLPIVTELHKDVYKVSDKKTKESKDKTFSSKSSLTFTPSLLRDQRAEFICRVEHPSLEKPIERRTGPIKIDLSRPQVGEIKFPKLEEDKEATLTCDISGYFPEYMRVNWYRELPGKDEQPIIAPNGDFQICTKQKKDKIWQSSLTFTPSFSRDQGAEFICRVVYPGLEKPIERRTGPIRIDLPRPQVGKINIPKLEEDKEATLTCDIYGSFPKYINVSWYRKEPGTDAHPSITPLPNDAFKIHTKKIDKDKTCQSSLTFTPSLSRDQGAEFICRVEYPSLEQPVEKTTGPIKVTTHSVNGAVKAQQKASSRQ
ncbi:uncharacterized protein LOC143923711 isoform X1 [Lithobates pipiens]